jgi:hypothetical protein
VTIPAEEARAIVHTREFLWMLCVPQETPDVPRVVRVLARQLLKHYPSAERIEEIYKGAGISLAPLIKGGISREAANVRVGIRAVLRAGRSQFK